MGLESLMADQEIRDKNRRLLGKIKSISGGRFEIRNATGKLLGKYDPKQNETRNASGGLVGKGNQLTTLL